ncbi:hypothetical protein [Nafulsella turpanensis]|uniref:hypothetical protein n=1 Tax=Nafulsella turpanensis TaxID=1265690 RepID=UPI0003733C99|nr:hypothetical protein [Nafulsella turpanensis]
MTKLPFFALFILFLCFSCTSEPVEIEGFKNYVWKRDKWGCSGERAEMVEILLAARQQLTGLREAEVIRFLGKPDAQELYERNQKFLIYFLEPNINCSTAAEGIPLANALFIRLNATGLAKELFVRKH